MQKIFLDILKTIGFCTASSIKIVKIASVSQTEIIHRTAKNKTGSLVGNKRKNETTNTLTAHLRETDAMLVNIPQKSLRCHAAQEIRISKSSIQIATNFVTKSFSLFMMVKLTSHYFFFP
jgi:hypothetical protein